MLHGGHHQGRTHLKKELRALTVNCSGNNGKEAAPSSPTITPSPAIYSVSRAEHLTSSCNTYIHNIRANSPFLSYGSTSTPTSLKFPLTSLFAPQTMTSSLLQLCPPASPDRRSPQLDPAMAKTAVHSHHHHRHPGHRQPVPPLTHWLPPSPTSHATRPPHR